MTGLCPVENSRQSGMILIGVVFALVVLSSLTVAMLSQTATTLIGQAVSAGTAQAYYAAESGYRYAASKIRHGANLKTDLDDVAGFSMGGGGVVNFALDVYPYYYETDNSINATPATPFTGPISAATPGGVETGEPFAINSGFIKIVSPDKSISEIYAYNTVVNNGTAVTFNGLSPALVQKLPSGAAVLPVVEAGSNTNPVGLDAAKAGI